MFGRLKFSPLFKNAAAWQGVVLGDNVIQPGAINPDSVTNFFLFLLKLGFVVAALIYVVFSLVVVRQISVMRRTLKTSLSPHLQLLGIIHLLFAIAIVIWLIISL